MMLKYLLESLNPDKFECHLVSFQNGELLAALPAHVKTHFIPYDLSIFDKVLYKFKINRFWNDIRKLQKSINADIWYFNTIKTSEIIHLSKEFSVKTISHFHELPLLWSDLKATELEVLIGCDLVIGCSEIVSQKLCLAGASNVQTFHEVVDFEGLKYSEINQKINRQKLNIPEDAFIWVMSGTTDQRKGFDYLPQIAQQLNDANVHLLWLGREIPNGLSYFVKSQLESLNSQTKVHLLGQQKEDYYNYLSMADGFMLTSREDPFPLVNIEAAYLQKPIVAFDSGGVREFVQEGMGTVIDSWRIADFVQAMRNIMEGRTYINPQKLRERALEFDVKTQIPKLEQILDEFINTQRKHIDQ
jgi:L-malate glycosyltransferase